MGPTAHPVAAPATTNFRICCSVCGADCPAPAEDFRCPACGELIEITFPQWSSVVAAQTSRWRDLWKLRRQSDLPYDSSGVWRFREMLPHPTNWSHVITIREGNTPLYELPKCALAAGMHHLLAKHQGMNPTGSFKDTGMTAAITFAKQNGFEWVACASTGNTSASMAAYAARGGMRSLVLIPDGKIAWGKLSQSLDYGALTVQLRTDFDGCVRVLNEIIRRYPVYLLNSVNPFRLEGQKTAAIEMMEQLAWYPPEHIIVPGGNLGNSSAIGKALVEMKQLGLIDHLPKLSIIQAEGANPLYRSLRETDGQQLTPVKAETLATAIRIGNPASWRKALRSLRATGGCVEQVNEAEIAIAKAEIGSDGIGCEPASAVTLAGLKKLVRSGFVRRSDKVVLVLTGNVLKDPDYTIKFHRGDLSAPGISDGELHEATAKHRNSTVVLDPSADAVLKLLETEERRDA